MIEQGPFILAYNDGDWFVIPKSRESDFDKWTQLPTDNEEAWVTPPYAKQVGGSPSRVWFNSYVIS